MNHAGTKRTIQVVKTSDAVIVGGGIIGLSLAISLRKQGLRVLVVERGEPGREASHAAAGMLAPYGPETPLALAPLAQASFGLYPEFVHELEDESGSKLDLRNQGTILISQKAHFPASAELLSSKELRSLEPAVGELSLAPASDGRGCPAPNELRKNLAKPSGGKICAAYLAERSVDPRALVSAALKAARHREVNISSGNEVKRVLTSGDRATGVETEKASYAAEIVVNCAGAWAGCFGPHKFPTRPVKGQMLAVVGGPKLTHAVRAENVYLVPRSDGRTIIGSTLEEAGYNQQTDVNTIQLLFQAAVELAPEIANSRKHEDWAGLRPGTPDSLPILGETSTRGYFVATGHYRDGILLAPITAQVMTDTILQRASPYDLAPFSPARFLEEL